MIKNLIYLTALLSSLALLSSCHREITASKFKLTVSKCNTAGIDTWPRDLEVSAFYFPPETNGDEALEQVIAEDKDQPSQRFTINHRQFNRKGNFNLNLTRNTVVVLLVQSNDNQGADLTKYLWLETTHDRKGELCVTYECVGCR